MKNSVGLILVCLALGLVAGCHSTKSCLGVEFRKVTLPTWFTQPTGSEQVFVPVDGSIRLPPHLETFAEQYELPRWVVYGVVRSLGAREFIAHGVFKTFTISDDRGETSVSVDEVHYEVDPGLVHAELKRLVIACSNAESELDRQNVLGRHVHRRFGGFLLFGLGERPPKAENLLMTSGVSVDPMETFVGGEAMPPVGWHETPSHFIETHTGRYAYGHPLHAFRQAEEEAIRELAKSLMVKFSHSRKQMERQANDGGDYQEDAVREEVRLYMRGVVVLRRAVDVNRGLCVVQVAVPTGGVARR